MKKILFSLALVLSAVISAPAATTPSFPGGDEALTEYISANMKYPDIAKENGIEGVVPVSFVVKTDGSIGSIKVLRMIDPDLEAEAIRLVKSMPAWIPAKENGVAVESTRTLDIKFRLQ